MTSSLSFLFSGVPVDIERPQRIDIDFNRSFPQDPLPSPLFGTRVFLFLSNILKSPQRNRTKKYGSHPCRGINQSRISHLALRSGEKELVFILSLCHHHTGQSKNPKILR